VLVVDDEEVVRSGLGQALRARGFEVETVASSQAAIEKLSPDIDVLLVDWRLGRNTADELLAEAIRRRLPCGRLVMSGLKIPEPREAALDSHSLTYLEKPLDIDELCVTCHQAVEVARLRRRIGIGFTGVGVHHASIEEIVDELAQSVRLTRRRREALLVYLGGDPPAVAAAKIGISQNTYYNHLKLAVRDLGVESRLELLRKYGELVDARRSKSKT
jgi:DNA-binding NarL/FixJ family response regulator